MNEQQPRKEPAPGGIVTEAEPVGLDHLGDDSADALPEDDVAIELPIEQGDFDAQPH